MCARLARSLWPCFGFPGLVHRESLTIIARILLPDYQAHPLTTLLFNLFRRCIFFFFLYFYIWDAQSFTQTMILNVWTQKEVNKMHWINTTKKIKLNIQTPFIFTSGRLFFRQTTSKSENNNNQYEKIIVREKKRLFSNRYYSVTN